MMSLFGWVFLMLAIGVAAEVCRSPHVKGCFGEWIVAYKLHKGLPESYVVLNDVYLLLPDGSTTQIDHVVISPYGIFAVETKNYSGWIFADCKSKVWTQTIYRKKSTFQNPMRQNYLHLCAIADNLDVDKASVRGVVVFIGGCTFKTERPEGVVSAGGVASYIMQFRKPVFKSAQVAEIAQEITSWQDRISGKTKAAHVKNLKARHEGVSIDDRPRCPRCGGEMVLRTARSTGHQFFGCTNYPKCRGIVNVSE